VTTNTDQRPLGVRPGVVLTDEQLCALRVLQDYDLAPVRDRLLGEGSMPAGWVDEAIYEFRRYLGLSLMVPGRVPMLSRHVDHVWHTCLLFSRLYAAWCDEAFGRFLHHEPAVAPDPDPRATWRTFEAAYERLYGPLGRLWQMARPPKTRGVARRTSRSLSIDT